MENKRILAVVVTYFPEKELLEKNISAFIEHVDKVLIWENTPEAKKSQYRFIENDKVEYCGDGNNSISRALNYAWRYAESKGYDYLLTMDQDSVFENFLYYRNYTINNTNSPEGIWSPRIVSYEYPKSVSKTDGFVEMMSTITSGMLQKVSLITRIGGWNEAFAIDGLDDEYCFHANRNGIKTYSVKNAFLVQQYGNPKKVEFMGHSVTLGNYSVRRYYTIYRSHAQLMRMFPEQELFREICKSTWGGMIKWIFVFEKQGLKKLFYILKGISEGYFGKLPVRVSK